ncbi:MAG: hypothetical protein IJ009_00945 [Clostridia bacterium]|nr:hypothetical protein [Clostridia bacterium]MBQ8859665.1 hypothetical protein [Clostridia bacterium]
MKYFVIHSRVDLPRVKELIGEWTSLYANAQFIMLDGSQENWEGDATARIRECGKVLYVVGEKSAASPFIEKELEIVRREHKDVYVYPLSAGNRINDSLKTGGTVEAKSGEYEGEIVFSKTKARVFFCDDAELNRRLKKDSEEIEVILKAADFSNKDVIMEQYKMFVQTSEALVSRKQAVNSFYVTLNSILLGAIVSVVGGLVASDKVATSGILTAGIAIFLSLVGGVICCSWITLLRSYGDLNASKMAIIGCIEEHLALKLFDTEWAILSRKIGSRKYKSFTVKEMAVAKIFFVLYALLFVIGIVGMFL